MTVLDDASGRAPAPEAAHSAPAGEAPIPSPGTTVGARARRLWARPLGQHVLALCVVLLALTPLLGGRGLYSGDEGAALAQAELLAEGEGWGFAVPRPDLDPEGTVRPFDRADDVTGAPFVKHPVYPVVLTPVVGLAGTTGAKLLSVLGTVLAAVAAAGIAGRLRPGLDRPVLWAAGLASPLLFNAWLVIAHTLAAAACGFAALVVLRGLDRPRLRSALAVAALVVAAVLLRNEAVLFGLALAVGCAAVAWRTRSTPGVALAAVVLSATGGAYLLDAYLTGLVASPEPPFVVGQTLSSSNYLVGRLHPTLQTLVMPQRGAVNGADMVLIVAVVCAVAAAFVARRRPEDRSGIALLAVLAAAAGVVRAFMGPGAVPGLFTAFPALAAGLVLLTASSLRRPAAVLLSVSSLLFVGAVLATQYETGGTAEWGFRYAAIGLPLMIPLAFDALARARARLDPDLRVVTTTALIVLSGALAVLSLRTLDFHHRATREAVDVVEEARAAGDRPVVVTSFLPLGRMAWEEILAGEDWTLVEEGELEVLAPRLTADGGDVVLVSQDVDAEIGPFVETHEMVSRVPATSSGMLEVVRLVRR